MLRWRHHRHRPPGHTGRAAPARGHPDLVLPVLRLRRPTVAALLVAALATLPATGAPAQPAPTVGDPVAGSSAPVVHDPRVDDELAAVPVLGPEAVEATDRYRRDEQAHQVAIDDEARAAHD